MNKPVALVMLLSACAWITGHAQPARADNCPGIENPLQVDSDGDGVGNLCDLCPLDFDPLQSDTDGDGQGNACDCDPTRIDIRSPAQIPDLTLRVDEFRSTVLNWGKVRDADSHLVYRGDLASIGTADLGDCLTANIASTGFLELEAPGPGNAWFYLVQGVSEDCGVGSLGFASTELPRQATDLGDCDLLYNMDWFFFADESIHGTFDSSFFNTTTSNDIYETMMEEETQGNPSQRLSLLEHRWFLDAMEVGSQFELHVEGFRSDSIDGDDFVFEFSLDDGLNWQPIALESLPLDDDDVYRIAVLPVALSGMPIRLRVLDTDRTPGNVSQDSISIDHMILRSRP